MQQLAVGRHCNDRAHPCQSYFFSYSMNKPQTPACDVSTNGHMRAGYHKCCCDSLCAPSTLSGTWQHPLGLHITCLSGSVLDFSGRTAGFPHFPCCHTANVKAVGAQSSQRQDAQLHGACCAWSRNAIQHHVFQLLVLSSRCASSKQSVAACSQVWNVLGPCGHVL